MLSKDQNERLTRVGPGTPCGDLMRRYWHPVAPKIWLEENPVRSVRILGEDLTLFRDRNGELGLIGRRCLHRAVDMRFGIPEAGGLRCPYHGWMYDREGRCVEMPLEPPDTNFKNKLSLKAYPVQELGGLIWAYLGPQPAPLLPQDDLFVREDGFRQILAHKLPCNWLQVMENRGDPGHVYFTHGEFGQYVAERRGKKTGTVETERDESFAKPIASMRARGAYPKHRYIPNAYGYTKASLPSDRSENEGGPVWTHGMNPILFPYQLVLMPLSGDGFPVIKRAYQIGVPIDDTTTWHIYYLCYTFPTEVGIPSQPSIPYREIPLQDDSGEFVLDYTTGQDMVMWYAQGDITDRSEEHLGVSDSVIIAYRKLLSEQIDIVERGGEPMNVFREAASAYKREKTLPCSQMLETNTNVLEAAGDQAARPGGWVDLNLGGDIGRYCPDKALLQDLYQKTIQLWGVRDQSRHTPVPAK